MLTECNEIGIVLYAEVVTLDDMVNKILEHLAANAKYYKYFYSGKLLQNAEGNSTILETTVTVSLM